MSLKVDKRCKVCNAVKADPKLLKRLYKSRAYVPGGESLRDIAREHLGQFTYDGLWNHCAKHQGVNEADLKDKRLHYTARVEEAKMLRQAISHQDARQELVDIGLKEIRDGSVKMNASTVASLLKQQSDIEQKEKDRQLEVLKMVERFQSGEMAFNEEAPELVEAQVVDITT